MLVQTSSIKNLHTEIFGEQCMSDWDMSKGDFDVTDCDAIPTRNSDDLPDLHAANFGTSPDDTIFYDKSNKSHNPLHFETHSDDGFFTTCGQISSGTGSSGTRCSAFVPWRVGMAGTTTPLDVCTRCDEIFDSNVAECDTSSPTGTLYERSKTTQNHLAFWNGTSQPTRT